MNRSVEGIWQGLYKIGIRIIFLAPGEIIWKDVK